MLRTSSSELILEMFGMSYKIDLPQKGTYLKVESTILCQNVFYFYLQNVLLGLIYKRLYLKQII